MLSILLFFTGLISISVGTSCNNFVTGCTLTPIQLGNSHFTYDGPSSVVPAGADIFVAWDFIFTSYYIGDDGFDGDGFTGPTDVTIVITAPSGQTATLNSQVGPNAVSAFSSLATTAFQFPGEVGPSFLQNSVLQNLEGASYVGPWNIHISSGGSSPGLIIGDTFQNFKIWIGDANNPLILVVKTKTHSGGLYAAKGTMYVNVEDSIVGTTSVVMYKSENVAISSGWITKVVTLSAPLGTISSVSIGHQGHSVWRVMETEVIYYGQTYYFGLADAANRVGYQTQVTLPPLN